MQVNARIKIQEDHTPLAKKKKIILPPIINIRNISMKSNFILEVVVEEQFCLKSFFSGNFAPQVILV